MVAKRRACLILWTLGVFFSGCLLLGQSQTWAQADSAQIAKGEKVYAGKKCALCHMVAGKGGKVGADLTHLGAERNVAWLREFLRNPKALNPKAKMAPFQGNDEELGALIAYLASLK